jgi:hypothetical protein
MSISTSCGVGVLRLMFNCSKAASAASVPNAFTSFALIGTAPSAVALTVSISKNFYLLF